MLEADDGRPHDEPRRCLEVWREGQLDVDFIVSSEVETAHAISRTIGVPTARQTDVFAGGQSDRRVRRHRQGESGLLGVPLREGDDSAEDHASPRSSAASTS